MGRTSLATNTPFNVAKAYRRGTCMTAPKALSIGGVVGFYSLEMSAEQLGPHGSCPKQAEIPRSSRSVLI